VFRPAIGVVAGMTNSNSQDGYYFDDYDPDEPERDDGHHEEWVGLGRGVYLVCHALPDGRLLVGWSVHQPNGGYRMTLPRLLRGRGRGRAGQGHPEVAEDALDGLPFGQRVGRVEIPLDREVVPASPLGRRVLDDAVDELAHVSAAVLGGDQTVRSSFPLPRAETVM